MILVINMILVLAWFILIAASIPATVLGDKSAMLICCSASAALMSMYVFLVSGNIEGVTIGF